MSTHLPPGTCLYFLSRIGFSIPTARRFSSNVATLHQFAQEKARDLYIIRPCTLRFFQIDNTKVLLGAVSYNRKSYGAVRCGFQVLYVNNTVRFGFEIYPTVRFGAVFGNQKFYGAVWYGFQIIL